MPGGRASKMAKAMEALARVHGREPARNPGDGPLDHLVYGIIAGRAPQQKARQAFERLREGFVDWNELRVAEAREIVQHMDGLGETAELYARAELLRRTLQALFDARDTVRIDLSKAEDEEEVLRALGMVPGLSPGIVAAVAAKADPDPPIRLGPGMARVAQRIGIVPRSGGEAKTAAALASLAGEGEARVLAHYLLGEHAETACLPKNPACDSCPCREFCDYGKRKGAE